MRFWGPATGRSGGVREPAVAGRFYPGRASTLADEVDAHVAGARDVLATRADQESRASAGARRLVAVVAPHAGYVYSGPTAGFAYASIDPEAVQRVVLLGPAHFVPVEGIGMSTAAAWRTPLGDVPLDTDLVAELADRFPVVDADDAHGPEHSLEVQVPFLQRTLAEGWRLVPLIVGSDVPEDIAALVTWSAELPRTLIVVSTDLSHYLDYESAIAQDSRTIRSVVHRRAGSIDVPDACGRYPLRGLLAAAEAADWSVRLLDARNSGDTAGDRERVVGYAAFAVSTDAAGEPSPGTGRDSGATGAGSRDPGPARSTSLGAGAGAGPAGHRGPGDGAGRGAGSVAGAGHGAGASAGAGGMGPAGRGALLELARRVIEEALAQGGRRPTLALEPWYRVDPVLAEPGAAFVTLRSGSGELLGCIGSLTPRQPLVDDVAQHAYDAAFRDPRFAPLSPDRAHDMVIDISVLGPSRVLPCAGYDDLCHRLPVGSGVVVEAGRHRATFLPAVWDQLPDTRAFLAALWRKAGLANAEWPRGTRIEVYDCEEFAEAHV